MRWLYFVFTLKDLPCTSLMFMKSSSLKKEAFKTRCFTLRIPQVSADNSHWSSEIWFFDKAFEI